MNKLPIIPARYWMAVGTLLLALLLYIDRICISVAKEPIANSLSLTDTQMGWILSVFALGYALFQVPSGIMADTYGPRKVLSAIVGFWSLLTALTGAAWNFISLMLIRFFFGAGEAGAFPGMSRAIYSWIPISERGIITGVNFSGSRLGAAFALPLVAWLIDSFGWRYSFVILGVVGVLWAVAWYRIFRDDPATHRLVSEAEKAYILANRQQGSHQAAPLALRRLLYSGNVWLIMGQYFCSNFTFFFALTWLFPHIRQQYKLDSLEAGFYASIPLLFGAFGNWFSGWMVDYIFKKGRWNASRIIPAAIGFALAATGLIAGTLAEEVGPAVFFLSMAIFGADMTLPPSWSLCVDIGREHAGTVSGTMNMAGNLGSFLTALAFPYLQLWTGSVEYFFYIGGILNVLAILIWLRLRPDRGLDTGDAAS